jgi:hypothetical protein
MSTDLSSRHQSTRQVARWLTPNPNLPAGAPATVAAVMCDTRDRLLDLVGDGPEFTVALRHLVDAKDAAVRQAIADAEG